MVEGEEADRTVPSDQQAPLFVGSVREGWEKSNCSERVVARSRPANSHPRSISQSHAVSHWPSHAPAHQALVDLIAREKPHVFGLQETKIQDQHVDDVRRDLSGLLGDYKTFCEARATLVVSSRRLCSTPTRGCTMGAAKPWETGELGSSLLALLGGPKSPTTSDGARECRDFPRSHEGGILSREFKKMCRCV